MKLAIMQPYFFPYLGYFSLIKHTDKFILLDDVQFIRHGWIERNRVLKQNDDWLYIKVPLIKSGRDTLIKDCHINNNQNWDRKLIAQLITYKKFAPYYKEVINLLINLFDRKFENITELNKESLLLVCNYLNIEANIEIFSEMKMRIEEPKEADEWALNICKEINNVDEYWNPIGGIDFFDKTKYQDAKIKLLFHKMNLEPYNQKRSEFFPALSIIDVMMFNSVEETHKMLDNYELV